MKLDFKNLLPNVLNRFAETKRLEVNLNHRNKGSQSYRPAKKLINLIDYVVGISGFNFDYFFRTVGIKN